MMRPPIHSTNTRFRNVFKKFFDLASLPRMDVGVRGRSGIGDGALRDMRCPRPFSCSIAVALAVLMGLLKGSLSLFFKLEPGVAGRTVIQGPCSGMATF